MQSGSANRQRILLPLFFLALAGCSSVPLTSGTPAARSSSGSTHSILPPAGSGRGGYYQDDGPGDVTPEGLLDIPDADPKIEPYSKSGNKPYVVFGKRYVPITDDQPFKQRGYGSWYGKKFHGQKTSSGELYDMYKMSAAHPTLPIPSYARVTNLSNGKQVIVRVNDRGPFHSSRVIDLSYTAALKLGYIGKGSTELEVERLLPADIERINAAKANGSSSVAQAAPVTASAVETAPIAPTMQVSAEGLADSAQSQGVVATSGFYLQFGAYSQMANAEVMRARLAQDLGEALPQLKVEPSNNLYRLYSGPFATRGEAASAALRAQQAGTAKPLIVQR